MAIAIKKHKKKLNKLKKNKFIEKTTRTLQNEWKPY